MGQYDRTIRKDDKTIAVPIRIYRNYLRNILQREGNYTCHQCVIYARRCF